jgi:hypothetical protein
MSDLIAFKINGEGEEIIFDPTDFPYPVGVEFERQTKIGVAKALVDQNSGTNQAVTALYWKGAVEAAAARTGSTFVVAARALPYEQFRATLNIGKTVRSLRDPDPVAEPEEDAEPDPTQPAASPQAPASPATSAPQPQPTPSPAPASSTSGSSPTTSASAPGNGTDSPTPTSAT